MEEIAPFNPPASPVLTMGSQEEEPGTPPHQKIPNPLLHPPGAPRKPRTLLRWVQRSRQDSLDLREYFLGLPVAHDLDLNAGSPKYAGFAGEGGDEHSPDYDDLLPSFTGSLFTSPVVTDYRLTGANKRPSGECEGKVGKRMCPNGVPSFRISCHASLLDLEDAPDSVSPASPPTPVLKSSVTSSHVWQQSSFSACKML